MGDEHHARERQEIPAPRPGRHPRAAGRGGEDRDEHGHGPDHDGGVANRGPLDPGVLEDDHPAESDRPGREHGGAQRVAQLTPRDEAQHGRGDHEPGSREPRWAEPAQRELGQRDGQTPQDARRDQRHDCVLPETVHTDEDCAQPSNFRLGLDITANARLNILSHGSQTGFN
ncbi:MAG TPA: hypothetical protein VKT31_00150 [Solirubrobacteraceae bacterium]|nr:hypothetical protein [Solirubrobacteraceae bacterium]